ncbi:MAG: signal peptidase I [Planctomycetes bacterium]|nr:signal peptidase I [Planctomycetota bacterium]
METQTRKLDEKRPRPTTDASLRALEARELELGAPPPPGATKLPTQQILKQSPGRFYGAVIAAVSVPLLATATVYGLVALRLLPPLPGLTPGLIGWIMLAACAALLRSRSPLLLAMLGLVAGVPALAACGALNFQLVRVEGRSMLPTLSPGDVLIVDLRGNPREGARPGEEIYVLGGEKVRHGGEPVIKRLIGIPGDKIEIADGALHINGTVARVATVRRAGKIWPELTLADGEYFFVGDNPDESRDSRDFGAIDAGNVLGRAVWKIKAAHPGPLR